MDFLELKDIHKSFYLEKREFKVLNGINLKLNRGEFVSILGESGGGKTTLMNIIGGLDGNYTGNVYLNNNSLKNDTVKQLDNYRRKTIGFVFQNFNLISHLSALDNVLVSLEMSNLSHHEQVKRATELLKRVGLAEHTEKYPSQLSGGQKQRVSIARALASNPDVIIADEPTGALDAKNTEEVLQLLDTIAQEGKLVLTVTHSDKVANYGSRIVHMNSGKINQDKKIKASYQAKNKSGMNLRPLHFMNTMKMALKQMKYNLARNILIIIGGMIGIFSVIFMLGLGNGVRGYINHEIYSQVKPNAIQVTRNVSDSALANQSNMNQSDYNKLEGIKYVKKVEKANFNASPQISLGKNTQTAQRLSTYNSLFLDKNIVAGKKPSKDEVMLPKAVAQKFNNNNYKDVIGRKVSLNFTTTVDQNQPKALKADNLKVSGISDDQLQSATTNYSTMNNIYKNNGFKMQNTLDVVVSSNGTKNVDQVQNSIKAIKNNNKRAYNYGGAGSLIKTLNTYINLAVYILTAIAGISLLVSAIMIIVVLYISVSERKQEIGILRALGVTRGNVRMLFMNQAFLLGLFSSLLAVILSYTSELVINYIASSAIGYSIMQITSGDAIFGIIVAVIINLLAAIIPAGKGAKLDPVANIN